MKRIITALILLISSIHAQFPHKLTFDDVLLQPGYSEILPSQAQLGTKLTRNITLNTPVLSAAMDTVTESQMAIAIAQEGGIGIVHKNLTIEQQVHEVQLVKKFENGIVRNPITVSPDTPLHQLFTLRELHKVSGFPVVEGKDQLVGIVTNRDIRFEKNLEKTVSQVMTPKEKLITVQEGPDTEDATLLFDMHRLEKILVVNDQFKLRGMLTVKDMQKASDKPNACRDAQGRLRVGAAVGVRDESYERVATLVQADVDVIVVDTAHGHSEMVLSMVRWIKENYPHVDVIGGNIATAAAARALADAGADAVKVGVGPGSICTTRIVTGIGVPQLSAIMDVAQELKGTGIPIIADGGIRYSGDMCKALVAGASAVMMGSLFGGTQESPGTIELYKGRAYKAYHGMGSLKNLKKGRSGSERYFQFDQAKCTPEGIEARVPYKGSVHDVIFQMIGGLRSCMGYTGCETIKELHEKAQFVTITAAGIKESHVHDVQITKAAPNYNHQ